MYYYVHIIIYLHVMKIKYYSKINENIVNYSEIFCMKKKTVKLMFYYRCQKLYINRLSRR